MTKEVIVDNMFQYIRLVAEYYGDMEIVNKGTGNAFEHTFWKDILTDDSNIPNVVAEREDYSIELRSFWGMPELDIRQKTDKGEVLICITYSDSVKEDGEYVHTNVFNLNQVRIDGLRGNDYNTWSEYVKGIVDFINE